MKATLVRFAFALVATLAARIWLPLPATDPLRGTLEIVPLILAALAEIHARGRRAGGRRLPPRAVLGQLVALAGLVALTLARSRSGLAPLTSEILAGAFLLLLLHRVVLQLLALRPLLGGRLPTRPSAVFFWLPLIAYLAIIPWSTHQRPPDGDEPFYLLMTHSLAYDLDAELTNNYQTGDWRHFLDRPLEPQPGDPVGPGGEKYSRHNILLPIVLAPAYRLAGKLGALGMMAVFTAALAWMTLRLARHYTADLPGESLAAYALVAFAPPLLLYSYQVWVEVPAALLVLVAFDHILDLPERLRQGRARWRKIEWLGIGLPILLLPLVKIRFMLLAVPLLGLTWWHSGRPRKPLIILGSLLAAVGAGTLVHNTMIYGNPLKIHSWEELEIHHYGVGDFLEGAFGIFYDSAFGLFGAAPLWLLLVPAFAMLLVRRHSLLIDLAILCLPYFLIVVPRAEWYGGWSPPFRYALIALPLLGIALAPLLASRRRGGARFLLAGLGIFTVALTILWIAKPGWTYNFADGRTYLLDHLSRSFGTDIAAFFPSTVRPRLATWLWPPLTWVLVPLLWWRPTRLIRGAVPWATGALLLGLAVVPVLAARLPTRHLEFEDPYVAKSGGHLFPQRWTIERTRYRGGWVLRPGEDLSAPVNPAGQSAEITLGALFIRNSDQPVTVEILAGDTLLESWRPVAEDDRVWREIRIEEALWPPGAKLKIRIRAEGPLSRRSGVAFDSARLQWR